MTTFNEFRKAVKDQLDIMKKGDLFVVDVSSDVLWDTYLNSFPEGTNPIFKERTEHDCNCCKSFIRAVGGIVSEVNGELKSIWDVNIGGFYQVVADSLSSVVKGGSIKSQFFHFEGSAGQFKSHKLLEEGGVQEFDHFHYNIPPELVKPNEDIASFNGLRRSERDVMVRSIETISMDSIDIVMELIGQNSLYRGEEHLSTLKTFKKVHKEYTDLSGREIQDIYSWKVAKKLKQAAKLRNTAIGTLLLDISEGTELEDAVRKFEAMVAPANYKRTTALVTKGMIQKAQAKVEELGIEDSLHRRFATIEDITINNVLFADRTAKESMGVFGTLYGEAKTSLPKLDKIEEVSIKDFLDNILPKVDSMEVLVENKLKNNLVSLIAPKEKDTKNIFKWGNNFSWAYNGDVADSIKERVKRAGGSVGGFLRCSLSWYNSDDLDLHVLGPRNEHIFFSNKVGGSTGGKLDVDMNASTVNSKDPVENIIWPSENRMLEGDYKVIVHNYTKRSNSDLGFQVEMEVNGTTKTFSFDKAVTGKGKVEVVVFNYSKAKGITVKSSIGSKEVNQEIWGINTGNFHKVSTIMNSPNHWDGEETGNKHVFFMLEDCNNPEQARGFYNEFLSNDLMEHRKVFEVLGSKLKTEKSNEQLSGLGFSSTQRNDIVCRVKGKFNRVIKIKF